MVSGENSSLVLYYSRAGKGFDVDQVPMRHVTKERYVARMEDVGRAKLEAEE